MKQLVAFLLVAITSLSLVANADDKKEISEKLRNSGIVGDDQTILITSNVYFYPGKKGYGFFSGGKDREKGHIVFTDEGFAVVSWKRSKDIFEPVYETKYVDLDSSEVTGNSPMVRLVTKDKDAEKYNSFEIMDSRNAFTPNPSKTKEANEIVNAGIEGLDVIEVASAESIAVAQSQQQQKRLEQLEARLERLENADQDVPEQSTECDCKCPPE
ncbi:MAG: hypothetical protein AAGB35_03360 [Pseudomonadota bacterium]